MSSKDVQALCANCEFWCPLYSIVANCNNSDSKEHFGVCLMDVLDEVGPTPTITDLLDWLHDKAHTDTRGCIRGAFEGVET